MSSKIAALVVTGVLFMVGSAYAQEATSGPGLVEVTYMPAGCRDAGDGGTRCAHLERD